MERQRERSQTDQHEIVKEKYDEVQGDGGYEEGMARMALYHHHCQDPVIFRTLGDIRGKSLLDLACGDGFYTRRFRTECAADPVVGIDLSPKQIEQAEAIEQREQLGIKYKVGDVMCKSSSHSGQQTLFAKRRFWIFSRRPSRPGTPSSVSASRAA